MGLNLVGLLTPSAPVALYAKWDAFLEGFARMAPSHYTPSFFDSQSFGGDLRWRLGPGFEISGNAGRSLLRGQYRDDLYYTIKRGWLALDVAL